MHAYEVDDMLHTILLKTKKYTHGKMVRTEERSTGKEGI